MKFIKTDSDLFVGISLLTILLTVISFYAKDYLLIEKAKKNASYNKLESGCLFLVKKYADKNGIDMYLVNIDGDEYLLRKLFIHEFPYAKKAYNFGKNINYDESCYKVTYVKVSILFFKRSFIYDLES